MSWRIGMAAWAFAAAAAAGEVPQLPPLVRSEFPALQARGQAPYRHWWVHVYDATLWSPGAQWPAAGAFALDLRYAIDLKGADIAARSVQEMRRLGSGDAAQLARWSRAMERIFPDVRAGERLVGVAIPGREARFYDGRRLVGVVEDAAFVTAFFGIWLDARTSAPELRRKLLRLDPP